MLCYILIILFTPYFSPTCEIAATEVYNELSEEYDTYVLFVSDVQEYYQASSVFIIFAGNDENAIIMIFSYLYVDLKMTTLVALLTRELSRKSVLSVSLTFNEILDHLDYYQGYIVRPLFVVPLSTLTEVLQFQKVTRTFEMSYPFWLILFTNPMPSICPQPVGNFFNLTFDTEMIASCDKDNILHEWYSLQDGETIVTDIGQWDPIDRLKQMVPENLYERRNSLGGKDLRICTVKASAFVEVDERPLSGLFGYIIRELSLKLNFSAKVVHREDFFGSFNTKTGQWSRSMGRLVRNECDIAIAEYTMTSLRMNYIDYTLPMVLSRSMLYVKRPEGWGFQWNVYFRVYNIYVWIALNLKLFFTSIIITFIKFKGREKSIEPNRFLDNYFLLWGICCQKGLPVFPNTSSLKIAYFSILISAVFFLAVYSASLTSYLTVTNPSLPFSTLEEFAAQSDYKLIVLLESEHETLLKSTTNEVMQKMDRLMLHRKYSPRTVLSGFDMACREKLAFYTNDAVKSQIGPRIPCDLIPIETGRIISLGMALTKKNPYRGLLNFYLQKFKDVGIMNRLKGVYYWDHKVTDTQYEPVNIHCVITILLIMCAGIILSILILVVEIYMNRRFLSWHKRTYFGD